MNKHTLSHMNSGSERSIIVYQYIYLVVFHAKTVYCLTNAVQNTQCMD